MKRTCSTYWGILLGMNLAIVILIGPAMAQAASQTPEQSMSDTVEVLCPVLAGQRNELTPQETDVFERCAEVKVRGEGNTFDNLSPTQKNALLNMTSEETDTMGTLTVEVGSYQFGAVTRRLTALRAGGSGGLASFKPADLFDSPNLYAGPVTSLSQENGGTAASFGRIGVFVNSSYSAGDKSASDIEPGFDFDAWGVTAGADYRISDSLVAGLAIGYTTVSSELDDSIGDIDADGYGFSVYGSYYVGNFHIDAIGTFGRKDYESVRNVRYTVEAFPGPGTTRVNQSFSGDTEADELALNLSGGYDFYTGGVRISPFVQLNYFDSQIDGYRERLKGNNSDPGNGLALAFGDQDVESLTSVIGAQVAMTVNTGFGVLIPHVSLDWTHEFEDDDRVIKARFADVRPELANLNQIEIPTDSQDANFFNLALGISTILPNGISAFADYATVLGLEDFTIHTLTVGIRIEI